MAVSKFSKGTNSNRYPGTEAFAMCDVRTLVIQLSQVRGAVAEATVVAVVVVAVIG